MKNNITYIILSFVLCFGFKVQAQSVIDSYQTKLKSLSKSEVERLEQFVNGATISMYVGDGNKVMTNQVGTETVVNMVISKSQDFALLSAAFSSNLKDIVIINIEWDGLENYVISEDLLSKLKSLKYVYIRSYMQLNESVIQTRFTDLLQKLKGYPKVEVLYYTMEQAS